MTTAQSRLDWLEEINTLHRSVEFLYEVDGYQVTIVWDGEPISPDFHGATLEQAIDAAIAGFDMEASPKWRHRVQPLTLREQHAALLSALQELTAHYTEPTGIQTAQILDNEQFGEFLKKLDRKRDKVLAKAQAAIAAATSFPRQPDLT